MKIGCTEEIFVFLNGDRKLFKTLMGYNAPDYWGEDPTAIARNDDALLAGIGASHTSSDPASEGNTPGLLPDLSFASDTVASSSSPLRPLATASQEVAMSASAKKRRFAELTGILDMGSAKVGKLGA